MNALIIVCFFTFMIHMAETLALSMRLAGVRTKQVASSISFVNASFLIARMSNMFQAPLLGAMVDLAVNPKSGFTAQMLGDNFRIVIFAAFIGNAVGAFLTPSFARIFEKGICVFEKVGSIPKLVWLAIKPRNLVKILTSFRFPTRGSLKGMDIRNIPKAFLILNVAMVSIYAIGVLASLFAGAQIPQLRATATQLSGIVNGIATIIFAIMVDPTGAHIVDQVVRGKRKEADARTMVFYLIMGRLFGTLIISQLIFLSATSYIMTVTQLVTKWFGG